ncbi:MAG: thioredoxin family protein [Bacteroidetes bacterium]|nr:thioredoxin family protein [Bacteroidota bacterium]
MIIKILGSGCSRCDKLFKRVNEVVAKNSVDAEVLKVDDVKKYAKHGILMTPALVINDKLICSINVPSEKDILKYINENT